MSIKILSLTNLPNNFQGKIEKIDDISFKYHNRHTYSELGDYVGKLKEINGIQFKYNENYSGNINKGSVGKINIIGNIK